MRVKLLTTAIRCSDCTIRDVVRGASVAGRHTFSTSSTRRRHGAVPEFTEASSPELHDLLDNARRMVIMPAHLAKEQQDLIYKNKNKKVLASEEASATIGDEEFKLEHIDRTTDVPNGYRVLWDAIALMKERKDWDNLPRLLHGLNNASVLKFNKQKNRGKKSILVRKISQAGRQDVLLECIRRSAVTGMTLHNGRFVGQVMFWFQMKALESDWDAETTSKALKWAEMVATMMEDPSHTGGEVSAEDPWTSPEVSGILLELAAVRASKHLGGDDKDGKVAEYAGKLVQCLGLIPESTAAGQSVGFTKPGEGGKAVSRWIFLHAPILYGMRQALSIIDPASETASRLELRAGELESMIRMSGKQLADSTANSDHVPNGLQLYAKLFPDVPLS